MANIIELRQKSEHIDQAILSLDQLGIIVILILFAAASLKAQVSPAPGWCSTAHCDNQMTDFVSVPSSFITTFTTLTPYFEVAESGGGVGGGLGCVSNGTNVACSYKTSTNYPHALVYYNADGSVKWKSAAGDLDFNTWGSAPLIQADGSVIIGDEINIIKYNSDGTKDWTVGPPRERSAGFAGYDASGVDRKCYQACIRQPQHYLHTRGTLFDDLRRRGGIEGEPCPAGARQFVLSNLQHSLCQQRDPSPSSLRIHPTE